MNYYPVELFIKGSVEFEGVFLYAVYANKDVAFYHVFFLTRVEGDDICVSLMPEILDVYLPEVFI